MAKQDDKCSKFRKQWEKVSCRNSESFESSLLINSMKIMKVYSI